ncbi:MAG: hypothetical protein U0133_03965 [Gemmatimonadales bacterium]
MMRDRLPLLLLAGLAAGCADNSAAPPAPTEALSRHGTTLTAPTLTPQVSGTTNGLIAVSPLNSRVVWAAGRAGTYTRTTDGGATWRAGVVPGAEGLQFRDVEAISAREAYLLSIGSGTDSRIYHTSDAGATWQLQFQNPIADAFYDCFAFWNRRSAVAMSDAVNGRFPILRTTNGSTWTDIGDKVVPALPGEAGFASSGTCIATHGRRHAWFVTGGASTARVIATTDGGEHWRAFDTPLRGSPSAGIFSVAFRDRQHGIIAGGDLDPSAPPFQNIATSRDGGASWTLGGLAPVGTVFGIAYLGHGGPGVVATGPGGTAWSADEGAHWTAIDGLTGYWAVAFANPHAGWVVGVNGTITKVSFAGGDDDDDRHDDD